MLELYGWVAERPIALLWNSRDRKVAWVRLPPLPPREVKRKKVPKSVAEKDVNAVQF